MAKEKCLGGGIHPPGEKKVKFKANINKKGRKGMLDEALTEL